MRRHLAPAILMITLLLACAATAMAEGLPSTEDTSAAVEDTSSAVEAAPIPVYGMQVWLDQETGQLRPPSAEEARRFSDLLQKIFAQDKAAPQMKRHKDGTLSVALDESMLEFSTVRVEADGTLTRGCVDDADQALTFVEADTATAAREEK